MKKTAVLLDGGFVRKRFSQKTGRKLAASDVGQLAQGLLDSRTEELFRIYFYDCAPSVQPCMPRSSNTRTLCGVLSRLS